MSEVLPQQLYAKGWEGPSPRPLVSSLRIEKNDRHWHIHIWNRGGKAGTICVNAADGPMFVDRLLPPNLREERGNHA